MKGRATLSLASLLLTRSLGGSSAWRGGAGGAGVAVRRRASLAGAGTGTPTRAAIGGGSHSYGRGQRSLATLAMVGNGAVKHEIEGSAPTNFPGGIQATNHIFTVPLKWGKEEGADSAGAGPSIRVFAREVVLKSKASDENMPYLLYLQGGPGFAAPRVDGKNGWVGKALDEGFRVVLLDQRGVGRSTPVSVASLTHMGSDQDQMEYLKNFRADSIVDDCEAVRKALVGEGKKWTVLGQSFGGFCLLTYLSKYPEAIEAGLFTGGLPPLHRSAEEVYRATYARVVERNKRFYKAFPESRSKVKEIVSFLHANEVKLPGGGLLTPERFLAVGIGLGGAGFFPTLHNLCEDAFEELPSLPLSTGQEAGAGEEGRQQKVLKYSFLRQVEGTSAFDTNPLYALMHESIYMDGPGQSSNWAAQSVHDTLPDFDSKAALEEDRDVLFTGEMTYPWMYEGAHPELSKVKEVAQRLAECDTWPLLYDAAVLADCQVPCAGAVYYDDMYVERDYSEYVANLMPNCKIWITNEYQHSGLRNHGPNILKNLLGMVRGEVELPS